MATRGRPPTNPEAVEGDTIKSQATSTDDLQTKIKELRRPYTPEAVKFRPDGKIRDDADTATVRCLAYIDARLVSDRLNEIVGGNWWDSYTIFGGKGAVMCDLTVMGVTHQDVGIPTGTTAGSTAKAVLSDALKRAAVKFGIGAYLYALPVFRAEINKYGLTDKGRKHLNDQYKQWLDAEATQKYWGTPLTHGDSEGSRGDIEVDRIPDSEDEVLPATRPGSRAQEQAPSPDEALNPMTTEGDLVSPPQPVRQQEGAFSHAAVDKQKAKDLKAESNGDKKLEAVTPEAKSPEKEDALNAIFGLLRDKTKVPVETRKQIFISLGIPADASKAHVESMPTVDLVTLLDKLQGAVPQPA